MNNEPVLTNYDQVNKIYHGWNKERNEEVFRIIDMINSDYEHDSWDNIVDQLHRIKEILIRREYGTWQKDMNVNKFMEKHNENKTEATREFGKEL